MKKAFLNAVVVLCAARMPLLAGVYFQQATFNGPVSTLAGMDRDAVGNLYLMGMAQGATTYQVTGEATPGMTPLFSFDTGLSSPSAFVVEDSGIIDVLNSTDSVNFTLRRFTNPGTFVGQSSFWLGMYLTPNMVSTAIDRVNERIFIAYQYTYHPIYLQCLGCGGPSSVTKATINEYDFSGTVIRSFSMPGADYTAGSCYTPTKLAADPQGNLYVADASCQQVLKFSPTGSLTSTTPASRWTYSFSPRGMWTDSAANLYISGPVCGANGCPQGVVKLGSDGSFQTSLTADSAAGCAWDQRVLYLSSSGSQPLRRFVYDGAPTVPAESGPFGLVVQHSSAATLSWQASSDPDGDPVTYTAYLGTNPNQLSPVGTATQAGFTTQPLTFGVTYYWQIVAQDSYVGLPLQQTSAPVESLNLNLINHPPAAFSVTGGTGTVATRATSANLSWQAAVDPDGDDVVYDVFWGTTRSGMALLGTTAAMNWPASGLSFGTTYYWSVRARDVYNAATTISGSTQTYSQTFLDSPPPAPAILSGTGSQGQHTLTPSATLSWNAVANAQSDPIGYRLYAGASANNLSLIQDSTATSANLSGLGFGTTYYWTVTAYDPYGGSAATPVQALTLFLQDAPPQPFAVLSGIGTLPTRGTSQLLSWAPAVDPDGDPVSYELDLSTNPSSLAAVQASTATSFNLGFQLGTTYYWQVTARDPFGGLTLSGLQSFLPVFLNHPPTAPANQSKTGTIPFHGFSPSQSFFWGAASDPDGDPITYSLAYGTDSAHMAVSSATLGLTLPAPLNTGFFYSIVATDIYGAASASPVNWVFYQFANNPPGPFDVAGTTGTVVTRQTSASISWTGSVDPDGDPVSYGVLAGTSPASLALIANTTKNSAALSNLAFGTTYYWRVDAYDGFGGTTTANAGVQSLLFQFYDPPPSPVVYLSTASSYSEHTTTPVVALNWAPSSNAAGDPISYRLDIQTSTGPWPAIAMGASTGLALNVQLATTYYWRIAAVDPYGATSTGVWTSFIVLFQDAPPPAPVATVGAGTVLEHALAPQAHLAWSAVQSPYGDPVAYQLYVGVASNSLSAVQLSSPTAYDWPTPLFGTTYYWQVSAADPYGAASTSTMQSLRLVFQNNPPGPFAVSAGTGTLTTRGTVQLLSWTPSADPDGDSVGYALSLSTMPGFKPIVQLSSATSYALSFQFGTTYYWSVSASDGFGGTSTIAGGTQTFLPVFQNDPPSPLNVISPFKNSPTVKTMRNTVAVSWDQVSDLENDPITYTVYFGDSPQNMAPLAAIGQAGRGSVAALAMRPLQVTPQSEVTTDSNTVTLTLSSLDYYKTYYLRIAASNPYGATTMTPTAIFTLASPDGFPKAYNYPNPFNPNRGGTNLVFNAPPSGYAQATVEVYSEWQALLYKQDFFNIPPGISQVQFSGRDRYGKPFFNGSYICRVRFSGPDDKQIFYMLVVK
jgi:hypothetical protein